MRPKHSRVGTLVATIPLGCHPTDLAVDEDLGKVFIAHVGNLNNGGTVGGSIWILHTATGHVAATVPLGVELTGIVADPATHHVFVADSGYHDQEGPRQGSPGGPAVITTLDAATGRVLQTAQAGIGPQRMHVVPEYGLLIVVNTGDATVTVLDTRSGGVVKEVAVGQDPAVLVVAPERGTVLVANYGHDTVSLLDLPTLSVRDTIQMDWTPGWLAVDDATHTVLVTHYLAHRVSALDAQTGALVYALPVAPCPSRIVCDAPSGRAVVAHNPNDGTGAVTILERAASGPGRSIACTLPLGSTPAALAVDPRTGYGYVAQFGLTKDRGALTIFDLDAGCGPAMVVKTVSTGLVPRTVVVATKEDTVFVVSDTPFEYGHEADDVSGSVSLYDAGGKATK